MEVWWLAVRDNIARIAFQAKLGALKWKQTLYPYKSCSDAYSNCSTPSKYQHRQRINTEMKRMVFLLIFLIVAVSADDRLCSSIDCKTCKSDTKKIFDYYSPLLAQVLRSIEKMRRTYSNLLCLQFAHRFKKPRHIGQRNTAAVIALRDADVSGCS